VATKEAKGVSQQFSSFSTRMCQNAGRPFCARSLPGFIRLAYIQPVDFLAHFSDEIGPIAVWKIKPEQLGRCLAAIVPIDNEHEVLLAAIEGDRVYAERPHRHLSDFERPSS
jgi:hypothetical protein